MGKIVVGVVAFSMFAFILTDLLNSNSVLFGQSNNIGEINDNTISYQAFQNKVDQIATNYALNTGRNPSSDELEQIRNEAWQQFIIDNVFEREFEKTGISVTDAELVDMVQGNNINPQIQQFFTDPNTGQFDRQNVITFLQSLNNAAPQQRASWLAFEATLAPNRKMTKYENLLELTRFANKIQAENEYKRTQSISVDYLYVPYFSVPDSTVTTSDDELRDYLNDNSNEFQRESSKDAIYVEFEITPSPDDSAFVRREVEELLVDLKETTNDSTFAGINSDGLTPYGTYKPDNLPEWLSDVELEVGNVTEPKLVGNTYTFSKISDVREGDEYFVKASHILIKSDGDTDADKIRARSEANRILRELKNGADFATMAAQYGTDGTASRGGDLGWFGENGNLVQEFKDPCFAFNGTGLLPNVVETEFGYHIIEITEAKTNLVYKIATIEKELFASDQSLNAIYRQADLFSNEVKNSSDFYAKAEELDLRVRNAVKVGQNDRRFGGLPDARSIVYWLFNKGENGKVSEVFELEDKYVVAMQTAEQDEGTANLEDVRNELNRKVLDSKKADVILSRLDGLDGSFEEISSAYGEEARVGSGDLTLSSNSFPGVGLAPEAIGVAFSLQEGESTLPFSVQNGVLMITCTSRSELDTLSDYEAYRSVVLNSGRSIRRREAPFTFQALYDALIEKSDIEDDRYKFF
jgi:peptidyl-prolyl cis-trans isomerase D